MVYYQIFRNNLLIATAQPDASSELNQKFQSEDFIRMSFVLNTYIDLQIGDFIYFGKENAVYTLNKKPSVTEQPSYYKYECIFEGILHDFKKVRTFLYTPKVDGTYIDYRFDLLGNADSFLDFIIQNLNRIYPNKFARGTSLFTNTVLVSFNNFTIFESLYEISRVLGFSWRLEGNVLHFGDKPLSSAILLQVGRYLGFKQLTRQRVENENVETVVYGYGETANLPPRNGGPVSFDSEVLYENRLCFVGDGGFSRIEKNIHLFGKIEIVKEFNIKPERVGVVSSVLSLTEFIDNTMDFDVNDNLLTGITPKLTFISGLLSGYDFGFTYDETTKKYTLATVTNETGVFPNDLLFAAVDDTYILTDIYLPVSYIDDARERLKNATQDYINKKASGHLDFYDGIVDDYFIEKYKIELFINTVIRVFSSNFNIDNYYEIKELTQNIINPNLYNIKFGDVIPKNLLNSIKITNFNMNNKIYSVEKNTYTTNQTINEINNIIGDDLKWQIL